MKGQVRAGGRIRRGLTGLAAGILFALAALAFLGSEGERILPGVSVGGVDLSGLSRAEAEAVLSARGPDYSGSRILLWSGDTQITSVTCGQIGASPDWAGAAEAAWQIGREGGGLLPRIRRGWRRLFPGNSVEITPPFTVNTLQLEAVLPPAAADAAYDPASGEIREGRPGLRVDVPALCRALATLPPGGEIDFPVTLLPPEIDAAHLRAALFRDILGEYATEVGGSAARRKNVALSATAVHGTILLPGEVFDYNASVGQRTRERGYGAAPAYVNGATVEEIGGGICQTSSTLYAAALLADLEILSRSAHRYASSYIPLGLDATVSWGGPEFRFRNDTRYPVKIQAEMADQTLKVQIWGTRLSGEQVKIRSDVLATDPYRTKYQAAPDLTLGSERVQQGGYSGYTVQTYREVYDSEGNLLRSSAEARSVYRRRDKIVLQGTAAPPQDEPTTEEKDHQLMLDVPF